MVKLAFVNEDFISAMSLMSKDDEPFVAVKEALVTLACSFYLVKLETDVSKTTYKSFTKKYETLPPQSLPPTKGAINLHIQRANY